MGEAASIYAHILRARVRSQLQYPMSFLLQVTGAVVVASADFVAILVLFHHVRALAGWSLGEISFLYGSSYVVFKIVDAAIGTIEYLPAYIRDGSLDTMLTRPLGSLGQVVTAELSLRTLGGSLQGLAVLVFACTRVEIDWTPARAAVFVCMLVGAAVIFASVWVAFNAIAFWLIDSREVANAFTYGGNEFAHYPLEVFGRWLRRLLTFVVPVAFVGYLPALYILDKPVPSNVWAPLRFASPAVAAVAALVARAVWRRAVRRYRSTGS